MELNLEGMRDRVRRGQWSVDEFDWSEPLRGAGDLTRRQRRDAGIMLLFTAGLERRAAKTFRLCGEFARDDVTREIYELFHADEIRHAEAEIRLARRFGTEWTDLPRTVRRALKAIDGVAAWERADPGVYDMASSTILLFELALDGILIPMLKARVDDPLQNEIFRRIDVDESRHLAMDYWILDRKGDPQGDWYRTLRGEGRARTRTKPTLAEYGKLATLLGSLLASFGVLALAAPSSRRVVADPEHLRRYMERVNRIPEKAPNAVNVGSYQMALRGLDRIVVLASRVLGSRAERPNGLRAPRGERASVH